MNSRLKAIGLGILKGAELVGKEAIAVEGLTPVLQAFIPPTAHAHAVEGKVDVALSNITEIVNSVEAFGAIAGTPGDKKLAAATGMFAQLMTAAGQIDHKEVQDPELLQKALQEYVQATVDFENAFKPKG